MPGRKVTAVPRRGQRAGLRTRSGRCQVGGGRGSYLTGRGLRSGTAKDKDWILGRRWAIVLLGR